ncbi:MAG: hypothetical protein IT210_17530 [Armatimonadetes bacterium]|nr:hypothetical protein [Armatimonadota bacterium]
MPWLWLILLFGAPDVAPDFSPVPQARLSAAYLWVQVRFEGQGRWTPGRLGRDLHRGDRVRTGKRSQAELSFPDENRLLMAPSTEIHLDKESVHLSRGLLYGECFRPGAVYGRQAGVVFKSACFEYRVTRSEERIRCFSGEVAVECAGSPALILKGGQEVRFRSGDVADPSPQPASSEKSFRMAIPSGMELLTYPGSPSHTQARESRTLLRAGTALGLGRTPAAAPYQPRSRGTLSLAIEQMGAAGEFGPVWGQRIRVGADIHPSARITVAGRRLERGGGDRSDLTEAYLEYSGESSGGWKAGRFLHFATSADNNCLGTLISFDAADGLLWSPPLFGERPVTVGYFSRTNPIGKSGYAAWYARFSGGFWGSPVHSTLLKANGGGGDTGASIDVAAPLALQLLDIYGEYGEDPFNRCFYTAGLYVPWLYRQAGLDLFLEHSARSGFSRTTSASLSYDLGNWLSLTGLYEKASRGKTRTGIGVMVRVGIGD